MDRKAACIAAGLAGVFFLALSGAAQAAPPATPVAKAAQQPQSYPPPPQDMSKMTPFNVGPMIQPNDDPAKVDAARQFIMVFHPQTDPKVMNKMLDTYIPRLVVATKKVNPKLDEKKFAQERRASILSGIAQGLVNQSHVLSRHFTLQELKDLTAFYSSPVGRKLTAETPRIKQEMRMAYYRTQMPKPGEKDDDDDDDAKSPAKMPGKAPAKAPAMTPAKPPAPNHK